MSTIKEEAIRLIQSLPDDCSIEDIPYHLYVRQKVEKGLAAVESGRFVSSGGDGAEDCRMGQVHWSEPALDDLRDIVTYIAKHSPAYAARLASRSATRTAIFSRSFTRAEILLDSHSWTSQTCSCVQFAMTHESGGDVAGCQDGPEVATNHVPCSPQNYDTKTNANPPCSELSLVEVPAGARTK